MEFWRRCTSTEMNPTHTYTTEGTFDVTLEVSGALCEVELEKIQKFLTHWFL